MLTLGVTGMVATAVMVGALLVADRKESLLGRWLTKPVASAGFLVTAAAAGALNSRYGTMVLVALAFFWLGDVLLIPTRQLFFRLGLVSFLLGHVCLAIAFVRAGVSWAVTAGAAIALGGLAIGIGRWVLPHVESGMRAPVLAYIAVITGMVAFAAGRVGARGTPLVLAGALAFYASDLSVARDAFVKKGFVNRLWGLPVYYGACLLFAWSVR